MSDPTTATVGVVALIGIIWKMKPALRKIFALTLLGMAAVAAIAIYFSSPLSGLLGLIAASCVLGTGIYKFWKTENATPPPN